MVFHMYMPPYCLNPWRGIYLLYCMEPINKSKWIFYIVSAGICIILLAFLFYPDQKKIKSTAEQKTTELTRLVLEEHDCPRAIEEANAFLATNSGTTDIWSILGSCEFDSGKFNEAEASFKQVLSMSPTHDAAKTYLKKLEDIKNEIAQTKANQAEYEKVTGAVKKDYAPNLPPGFPTDFPLGNKESVVNSHIETIPGDPDSPVGHTYIVFGYTSAQSKDVLATTFSNYLQKAGYSVESRKSSLGAQMILKATKSASDTSTFTISVGDTDDENKILVYINYLLISPKVS